MRHLTLMRHAKAQQPSGEMTDHQRPLSKRGVRQAHAMAYVLQRWQSLAGKVCVSTALRTRQTFDAIESLHLQRQLDRHVLLDDALYTFDGDALLAWLKALPNDTERVLVIGHNPALVELAQWLDDDAPPSLPTGSVLHFTLPDAPWNALEPGSATLTGGLTPDTASYALFQHRADEPPQANGDVANRLHEALMYQHQRVKALKPGVMAGVDPEFLHQYRVSLRRSRAILESVRAITKVSGWKPWLTQLKRHARATSDLRDLDVVLADLDDIEVPLSTSTQQHLRQWLQSCQRTEHVALCQQLNAPGYPEALEEWQRWLASKACRQALAKLSPKRIQAVLDERVKQHQKALAALSIDDPDASFHDLRKDVKRLRYLADLHPTTSTSFLKELKRRQRVLGRYQDLCVRQAWLEAFGARTETTGPERQECAEWQAALASQKQTLRQKVLAWAPLPRH